MHINTNQNLDWTAIAEKRRKELREDGKPARDCLMIVQGIVRIFVTRNGKCHTEIIARRSRFYVMWAFDKIPPGIRNGTHCMIYGHVETGNMGTRVFIKDALTFKVPTGSVRKTLGAMFKRYSLTPSLYEKVENGNSEGIFMQGSRPVRNKQKRTKVSSRLQHGGKSVFDSAFDQDE